jgi:hypothetical protein
MTAATAPAPRRSDEPRVNARHAVVVVQAFTGIEFSTMRSSCIADGYNTFGALRFSLLSTSE